MKTKLLYSAPGFPHGYNVGSPRKIRKGRYILFPDTWISSQFLRHQERSGLLKMGPLITVRPRGRATQGHGQRSSTGQPLITQRAFYRTFSHPHASNQPAGGKTLGMFQHTFSWIGDVIGLEGSLQKQAFLRTERNKGRLDTRFHKICSTNGTRTACYSKLKHSGE